MDSYPMIVRCARYQLTADWVENQATLAAGGARPFEAPDSPRLYDLPHSDTGRDEVRAWCDTIEGP